MKSKNICFNNVVTQFGYQLYIKKTEL